MTDIISNQPQENETMEVTSIVPTTDAGNLILNTTQMNTIFKVATRYAHSGLIPDAFRNKPDDCFVACELAARMNVSPSFVMQNLFVVNGKPSWSGPACTALVNASGKFDHDLRFTFVGTEGQMDWGCFAYTHDKGELLKSTTITMQMARDEGWLSKKGSKWITMPEQMLKYRAAAFFARVYCPNVLMGFNTTKEELEDIKGTEEPVRTVVKLES